MLTDSNGRQVQTITLKDPEAIKASIDNPDADLLRECVIPLLMDIRNLMTAGMQSTNAQLQMGNAALQLLDAIRANTTGAPRIIGGR